MDESKQVAEDIGKRSGEDGERPRRQLARIAERIIPAWLLKSGEQAERVLRAR